ncbi:MAG: guanylate kinase [Deltaproteobacteria bacterium]|nr:guanylate kinase [Deltaproteobacteria bacterium]
MLFVISAPSGTGKTTLIKKLLQECPRIRLSVSYTTRPPRRGEKEGVDYFFITPAEFERMREKAEFIESAEVHGEFYGTRQSQILRNEAEGYDTLLDIDTQGARNLKQKEPKALLIFLMPPTLGDLEKRLKERATEPEEILRKRLSRAQCEIAEKDRYDYVIINDTIEKALTRLKEVIRKKG